MEITEFDENCSSGGKIVARHYTSNEGDTYKVMFMGGELYHPTEHKRPRQHHIEKWRSVSKEVFDGYLSFLRGREERKYSQIKRLITDGQ